MRTIRTLSSTNRPAGPHHRRSTRSGFLPLLIAVLMIAASLGVSGLALAAPANSAAAAPLAATLPAGTCSLLGATRTCELWAMPGTINLPGLSNVPVWGYADNAGGPALLPGPALIANDNETLVVILHNALPEASGLAFRGQAAPTVAANTPAAGDTTYTLSTLKAGTYLYEAGQTADAAHQVAMGLFGALIVRPAANPSWAYGNAASAFDDEALVILSEIDPALNNNPTGFNMLDYAPRYWLVNGKAYSDADPIAVGAGRRLLLRYLDAGLMQHSMGLLGLRQTVLAQDGFLLPFAYRVVAETIAAGQSMDTLVSVPASAPVGTRYAVYNTGLHLDNSGALSGAAPTAPIAFGGMLTFVTVSAPPTADLVGPTTSAVNAAPNPTAGASSVLLTANADDTATGGSNVVAAEWFDGADPGVGLGSPMAGTFGSPTASLNATINVSAFAPGNHTISVRSRDSANNWGPTATVVLNVTAAANVPPLVNAGSDQTITLPASASLAGTASDPDNGPGALTTTWTQFSGPGTTTFGNAGALNTTASFSVAGSYVLRLTASDGAASVFDDVTITVNNPAPNKHIGDLDAVAANPPAATWSVTVTIRVDNNIHGPVSGAFVTGFWTPIGGGSGGFFCTTNASGTCSVTRSSIPDAQASTTFTVFSVTGAGASGTYVAANNHDPDGDSTGTIIIVSRP